MIVKRWNLRETDAEYDASFEHAGDNAWLAWANSCSSFSDDQLFNEDKFEKQYHYKPIISKQQFKWDGLIFENEGALLLFILEWA
jgi:hypothetical protein